MPDKENAGSTTEEQSFEIAEETKQTEESTEIDLEGADPREVEMAKEHGLVPKEEDNGEHKEQSEPKTTEDTKKQAEEGSEEEVEDKTPTFEETEDNEELVDKYNPNEKALYWKWKNDKKKRQDAPRS